MQIKGEIVRHLLMEFNDNMQNACIIATTKMCLFKKRIVLLHSAQMNTKKTEIYYAAT